LKSKINSNAIASGGLKWQYILVAAVAVLVTSATRWCNHPGLSWSVSVCQRPRLRETFVVRRIG